MKQKILLLVAIWLICRCEMKAQILTYGWTAAATTAANNGTLISGSSTAVDASGNVYTTGRFSGTVDFDPSSGGTANLTSAGSTDLFIQKLDATANLVWVKRMGNADYEYPEGIALDASGNVYTTGSFWGTVDFDPNGGTANLTSAGSTDIFVQKLDAAGNLVWAKNMGGFGQDSGYDVAVDAGGNVYTTGIFHVLADFDPNGGTANLTSPYVGGLGVTHIFISKLDAFGNFVWVKGMSGDNHQNAQGIALDASGNVYTTGYFSGTADFDPNSGTANLSSAGFGDIFIQKLNSSGDYMWAKRIGNAGYDNPDGIALDASGNVYTAGSFSGTLDFDPGAGIANLSSAGENHIFIQKLDINGDYVWAKNMGGSSSARVKDIALDANGNVYTTGVFGVTADLDPSLASTVNLISAGSLDIFISKLDALGNYVWAKRIGGSTDDEGYGIAVDANGNVYTTGYFQGSANMNPLGGTDTKVGNSYGIFTQKIISCSTTSTIHLSICSGSSYTFNGIALSTAGTYSDTLVNAAGCDSIVTLHLLVIPNISANVNITNANRCSENGMISITPASGYALLSSTNFSSAIASPYSITNSASINNGQLQLTAATNSQNGALIYTPTSTPPNGLNVSFDMDMFSTQPAGNNIADGMSFNYGVISSSPTGNFEEGIVSSNAGLVIRFKTWQSQKVEVVYNGTVKATYDVDLHHPMIRKVQIAITPAGLFSMRIGNNVFCTNLNLGSSYATDNKSTWKIAWAARTGGSNNRHAIDNIEITNNNGIEFSIDNWASKTSLPFFSAATGSYTVQGGSQACASTLGTSNLNFNLNNFISFADSANSNCNGRTITISNSLTMDTLIWSDFASRPTLSNFNDLGNATFSNGSVQLTDNTGSQNGRIVFPQTPNAGVFTATFKARVWDGNNADGFSFNYGQIDNVWGADGGMMNTNTPGLSVCFPTWNTNNIIVKYKNNVLTTVSNTGSGGNRASFFTPIEVSVNAQYQLTVKWNGTTYISNYDLVANSTYETDAKTNWQFAWGARTGGSYDRHQLDDILVTGKTGLLFSYDGGTTYETNATKTINNANAVTVVVKADGTCASNTVSFPAITITTPTFTQVAPICAGTILSALPSTSLNGIVGTWLPSINNVATTTYTFTPSSSCNPTTTMTITVNPLPIISSVSATPTTICAGDSTTLQVIAPVASTMVSTLAGSGTVGNTNGPGSLASFDTPRGVATDAAGNVYVADASNHKIRKITSSGVVTTFAGSGIAGSADGNGTAASFNIPFGVATDATGNVYVADYNNHKIRKITSAGVVTTLAGSGISGSANGIGTAASFNNPTGVATDAAGNVYVADRHNNKIRKITPAGVVTTFAGSGSYGNAEGNGTAASFSYPNGVATDAAGNVYVADYFNYKIRKITSSGDVTTLAGSGISGSANGNGTAASFYIPTGVATDAAGNVYVSDYGNHKIRKITPSGDVTTFAGSVNQGSADGIGTAASFNLPHGVATDAAGNVYVADAINQKVRKITQTIVAPATYTWSGSVNGLSAALDKVSVMPVSTSIYTVTASTTSGCTATSTVSVNVNPITSNITNDTACYSYQWPVNGLYYYASGTYTHVVNCHTETLNLIIKNYSSSVSNATACGSFTWPVNGLTYTVSGFYTSTVLNTAGCDSSINLNLTINQSPIIAINNASPNIICAGDSSTILLTPQQPDVYVSTFAGTNGSAGNVNGIGTGASFSSPSDLVTDASGNIYVAELANNLIRKITPGGSVTTFAGDGNPGMNNGIGLSASFSNPSGIAIDVAGNLYVADQLNNLIRKITPAAEVTTLAGSGLSGSADGNDISASFNGPSGVSTDLTGNVYVADAYNNLIRKITPAGVVTTFAGDGSSGNTNGIGTAASFNNPTDLSTDSAGNLYVTDFYNHSIRKITPAGVVTTFAYPIAYPKGITIDLAGNLYVCDNDSYSQSIHKITPAGVVSILAGSVNPYNGGGSNNGFGADATFSYPSGLATNAAGNIYVADLGNQLIRKIVIQALQTTWSPSVNLLTMNADSIIAFPSSTTTYTVTATNVIGCTASSTAQVVVNNSTTGSSTVSTVGSYVFNSITYTTSGTYTATFINAAGCDSVHTLNLTITNPFVTVWKTNNPGTSNSTSITIPTTGTGYNYDVDWDNDGIYDQFGITGNVTHNYGTAGTYTVAIKGSFPRIYFNLTGDRRKIISILSWGNIAWISMSKAFMGCSNLTNTYSLTDSPNLSGVTDMSFMFYNSTFNQNISSWDVSMVTDMSYMFFGVPNFSQNISSWNVGAVTNMSYMFYNATNFNQNISSWNVSAVTNMKGMFAYTQNFNQDISSWNVSAVTNMSDMFRSVDSFNQNIGSWNVGAVNNMSGMFAFAQNFNQNISSWNVSTVTTMNSMFAYAQNFNQDISSWNVSAVIDLSNMYAGATSFNQNIGSWNVSAVIAMSNMFQIATSFNQNISSWNVGAVTDMSGMFSGATAFDQNIGPWNVANVQSMGYMFAGATSFDQNIGPWNVGNVANMSNMFAGATSFNQHIGTWNVGAVSDMSNMFAGATSFNQQIGTWNVGAVTDMTNMFNGATAFNQNIGSWNLSSVTDIFQIFLNSNISQNNYDSILIAWDIAGYSYLYVGNSSPLKYCAGATARASLVTKGWTITGDSFLCLCVPTSSTFNQSICNGSSYLFNGIAQTSSGTYLDTFVNASGCDSIVTLNLTIKATSTSTTNTSICSTELPYSWNGLTFTSAGSQTYHTANTVGCDSAATLNLTIKATSTSTTNLSICSTELPYSWNGLTFTAAGSQTYHTTNSVGCDSAATLNLSIKATSTSTTNLSICSTELPYSWNGLTFTSGGSQTFHTANSVGCDSAATLNLTIKATSTSTTNLSICSTELPYSWNGLTFTAAGSQTYHTANSVGCDSAATLNLTIKSTSASTTNLSICSTELPYSWNGLTFTSAGSQTYHTTNSVGCDSAATLNLTIKATSTSTTNMSQVGCYTWAVNNTTYTISGIYSLTYTNAAGCDSISTLNLTITPTVTLSIKAILAGAYDASLGLMHDSLRVLGLIPTQEPYSSSPFNRTPIGESNGETLLSSSVLNVTGPNAIVDWVLIELRSATNPSSIVANKRALIQRDGDIVNTDGVSIVSFSTIHSGNYYVSVKHRNHIGIMSASPVSLSGCSNATIDLTTSTPVHTISSITNTPRKQIGSVYAMWSGDVNSNKNVKYNGLANDKDVLLITVGAGTPNNSVEPVYRMEDVNMDGKIRYNNTNNDRLIIINNIGTSNPNNILNQHTPN